MKPVEGEPGVYTDLQGRRWIQLDEVPLQRWAEMMVDAQARAGEALDALRTVKTGICMLCGKPGHLVIDDTAIAKRAKAWQRLPFNLRPLIQSYLPELTPGQREQLMSGSHEACFDKAFPDEDDEELDEFRGGGGPGEDGFE